MRTQHWNESCDIMTYREFLNSLSDEDFAVAIANDDLFNMACVENYSFEAVKCPYGNVDCHKCLLALLQSDVDGDIIKR